jgi:hypothetical protein
MKGMNMKKYSSWATLLILTWGLSACSEKVSESNNNSSTSPVTTTGSTTGGATAGDTTGGSVGGGTTGGTGSTPANVFRFNVMLSGRPNNLAPFWYPGYYPGNYSSSQHGGDFYQISSQNIAVFKSDFRFKARVKPLAEPVISSTSGGAAVCYLRSNGSQNSATAPYSKLQFSVAIRDIIYSAGSYTLGERYASKSMKTANVNQFSEVFDWSSNQFPTRNVATGNDNPALGALQNGVVGHVVEIFDVMSDAYCGEGYQAYCPYSTHPNTRCWRAEIELATDLTQDF